MPIICNLKSAIRNIKKGAPTSKNEVICSTLSRN